MLCLTRNINQKIIINEGDIEVSVSRIYKKYDTCLLIFNYKKSKESFKYRLRVGDSVTTHILGVEVKLLNLSSYQVRIGVSADPSIPVHREEIHHKILEARSS